MEKGAGSAAAYEEYERRRAENIIWNAAGRYDFRPGYEAFDENGRADLYFNTVIGAAYRHYDFDKLDRHMRPGRRSRQGRRRTRICSRR